MAINSQSVNGTRNSQHLERGEEVRVTAKEWCTMSDHNKQLLLNAVAKK